MKLSARNILDVKISNIKEGVVNDEIIAKFAEQNLSAILTKQSSQILNLTKNQEVSFIIKAQNIIITKDENLKISIQNQLKVKISQIKEGVVNTQIIGRCNNQELCAIISNESCKMLELKIDDEVVFLINSKDIIVGILNN